MKVLFVLFEILVMILFYVSFSFILGIKLLTHHFAGDAADAYFRGLWDLSG
jgi:hypothetical protein